MGYWPRYFVQLQHFSTQLLLDASLLAFPRIWFVLDFVHSCSIPPSLPLALASVKVEIVGKVLTLVSTSISVCALTKDQLDQLFSMLAMNFAFHLVHHAGRPGITDHWSHYHWNYTAIWHDSFAATLHLLPIHELLSKYLARIVRTCFQWTPRQRATTDLF